MKTAIRMDDITPDMDWGRFNRIEKLLKEAGLKPLIGVVPYNKDENLARSEAMSESEFVSFLHSKRDEGWVIALHGYNHVYSSKKMGLFPLNNFSEFAGISYDRQLEMLSDGRKRLADWGIDTDIFMTPAHTYDRNTLRALKEAGFSKVTDGFGDAPYERAGLTFYPISKRQSDCLTDRDAYSTLVLHTNTMDEQDMVNFERKIQEHRDCFIDYVTYLEADAVRRSAFGNMSEYMTALAKFMLVRLKSLR